MKKQSNKKGFTLTELLAVIVLLGIILTLASVSISSISKNIKEKQKKNIESRIILAAQKYVNETGIKKVYVDTLIREGYLEADNESKEIQDPVDKESMNCYLVDFSKNINKPDIEEGNTCSLDKINDSVIFLTYCEGNKCNPETKFEGSKIDNKWINKQITLGVNIDQFKAQEIANGETFDATKINYNWNSEKDPSASQTSATIVVENTLNLINNQGKTYTLRLNYKGKDYIASGRLKIDTIVPKIDNIKVDKDNDEWASSKMLSVSLSDKGSGLAAYAIVKEGSTPTWETINGAPTKITKDKTINTSGTYYVKVKDVAGNEITSDKIVIEKIDSIAPTCMYEGQRNIGDWTSSNVTIRLFCEDNGGSECTTGNSQVASKIFSSSTKTGQLNKSYTIYDNAGNSTICDDTLNIYLDKTGPKIHSFNVSSRESDYNSINISLELASVDEHVGQITEYCITTQLGTSMCEWENWNPDASGHQNKISTVYNQVDGSGQAVVYYAYTKDRLGNISSSKSYKYTLYSLCSEITEEPGITTNTCSKACGGGYYMQNIILKDKYIGTYCASTQRENRLAGTCNTQACCSNTYPVGCAPITSCSNTCGYGYYLQSCSLYSLYDYSYCGLGTYYDTCNDDSGCYVPDEPTPPPPPPEEPGDDLDNINGYRCHGTDKLYITTCEKGSSGICNYTEVNGVSSYGTVRRMELKGNLDLCTQDPIDPGEPEDKFLPEDFVAYDGCDEYHIYQCNDSECNYDEKNGIITSGTIEKSKLRSSPNCSKTVYCESLLNGLNTDGVTVTYITRPRDERCAIIGGGAQDGCYNFKIINEYKASANLSVLTNYEDNCAIWIDTEGNSYWHGGMWHKGISWRTSYCGENGSRKYCTTGSGGRCTTNCVSR